MNFNTSLINRLGADAWLSNIAVNLIENGQMKDGYKLETNDYNLSVKKNENNYDLSCRVYVQYKGWEIVEITFYNI